MRIAAILFLIIPMALMGQDEVAKDNSKPTNVYSQLDNFLQFETNPAFNTFGYNPRLSYAPNEDNSIVLEIPFLYSTKTNKTYQT